MAVMTWIIEERLKKGDIHCIDYWLEEEPDDTTEH